MKKLFKLLLNRQVVCLLLLPIIVNSCKLFSDEEEDFSSGDAIARAGNKHLYNMNLQQLLPSEVSGKDSAAFAKQVISKWAEDQLIVQAADTSNDVNVQYIDDMVKRYRDQLIVAEFEKKYIQKNLNSEVMNSEIKEYYDKNSTEFKLSTPLVKGYFIQINKNEVQSWLIKQWIRSKKQKDIDELKKYSFEQAENYLMEDSSWVDFKEMKELFPQNFIPGNESNFLENLKYTEKTDSTSIYMLKILDYRLPGQQAPLDFAKAEIEQIILNSRKEEILKSLRKTLLDRAKKNNAFEIY